MNSRLWWMVFASGIAFGMAILLLIMIVAGRLPAESAELPADPCQRAAVLALRGELRTWQRYVYQYILDHNVTVQGYAKLTSYGYTWESEPGQNAWTASGSHVHTGGCAANPELPFGTLIWTPYGVRYVNDRGGAVKLRNTRRNESANFDYWTFGDIGRRHVPYAIVKPTGDRSVWMVNRSQWRTLLAEHGGDPKKAEVR